MSGEATSNTILCAGRLYCDLVFTGVHDMPAMGTETFSEGLSLHAGGGAFITSATFNALGWSAGLLATLPAAPFDSTVRKDIKTFGVDTHLCVPATDGSAPQITVAIAGQEDRAFLSHKTGPALPDASLATGVYRHLHIGEIRSLVEHPDLIEKARSAGMTISVDCGWDISLLNQGEAMTNLLSRVDVFLPNESEFDLLKHSGLVEAAAPLTVVKSGARGAKARQGGIWTSQPADDANVVDPTGAGDAFNGGFLSNWLLGKPLKACLSSGNTCGKYAVENIGGTGGLLALQNDLGPTQVGAAQ